MEMKDENTKIESGSVALKMFIEPSAGFRILREKPVFFGVIIVIALLTIILSAAIIETVGFENIIKERMSASSQMNDIPEAKRQEIIAMQSGPVMKYFAILSGGLASVAVMFLGGLYYWFSMNAMGSNVRFPHGVAVWAYSSLPPLVLVTIANIVVLAVKPVEDIGFSTTSSSGVVNAGPAILLGPDSSPALMALLSSLDFFSLLGWVLAVIGIKTVGKLSSATAVGIVALMALFGIAARVIVAALFG